jgi:hypothetical protein
LINTVFVSFQRGVVVLGCISVRANSLPALMDRLM